MSNVYEKSTMAMIDSEAAGLADPTNVVSKQHGWISMHREWPYKTKMPHTVCGLKQTLLPTKQLSNELETPNYCCSCFSHMDAVGED